MNKNTFEEKSLALVGLHTARTYLRLWEMFGPAAARGFVGARRVSLGKTSADQPTEWWWPWCQYLPRDTVVQLTVHLPVLQVCN